ncbi:hypothetical protein MTR_8g466640 [Medicago truncatula]|uniref:RNase H type-1 domain-containing protein n=1 Tax=Medicago truncatula TaxID=3880 RepID=A0A072TQ98_MEDTR|nr:hypothetical protein MTR_8g466640 [Medicago truncatula]
MFHRLIAIKTLNSTIFGSKTKLIQLKRKPNSNQGLGVRNPKACLKSRENAKNRVSGSLHRWHGRAYRQHGAGGVVRNYDRDWITEFSHYEVGGGALLAELRAIQKGLDFCSNKGYVNIICESDCFTRRKRVGEIKL